MKTKTMKIDRIEKLDAGMKFLMRANIVIVLALIIIVVTYYQVKSAWGLDHDTALLYGNVLGFVISFITVISLRHWRKRNVSNKTTV